MSDDTCTKDDCTREPVARGLCGTHYGQFRRSPEWTPAPVASTWHQLADHDPLAGTATCSICGPDTPVWLAMGKRQDGRRTPVCKTVETERRRRSRHKQMGTDKHRRYHRQYMRSRKYGMTILELEAFLTERGRCDICAADLTPATAHIDHDHACCPTTPTCGRCIRGVLCGGCNTGLGLLGDSIDGLTRALAYLQASSTP